MTDEPTPVQLIGLLAERDALENEIEILRDNNDRLETEKSDMQARLATVRNDALDEAAAEMDLAAHIMSHHGSDLEVSAYQNASKAILAIKEPKP